MSLHECLSGGCVLFVTLIHLLGNLVVALGAHNRSVYCRAYSICKHPVVNKALCGFLGIMHLIEPKCNLLASSCVGRPFWVVRSLIKF